MSGGHFASSYEQSEYVADEIDRLIADNDSYPPDIIARFSEAARTLRMAAKMARRIDWLVSGDDGEDAFRERWNEEVRGGPDA